MTARVRPQGPVVMVFRRYKSGSCRILSVRAPVPPELARGGLFRGATIAPAPCSRPNPSGLHYWPEVSRHLNKCAHIANGFFKNRCPPSTSVGHENLRFSDTVAPAPHNSIGHMRTPSRTQPDALTCHIFFAVLGLDTHIGRATLMGHAELQFPLSSSD